jgi:flagellar secretion chaperone FliS
MQLAQFAKSYRSTAVNTATPGHLVLMLYDGALRFMASARRGFDEEHIGRRIEQINNNLLKAQAILRELQASLDMKAGGEFSTRLFALYDFMLRQLQHANLKKEQGPIGVVEKLLGEIRDAWAQMLQQTSPKPV